jgi:ABC-2 type transport system ATP-binding protein
MTNDVIRTEGLVRDYRGPGKGSHRALNDFNLRVPFGEVHGLLGPNGAGKTTLVKILCTALLPTTGRAFVAGFDVVTDAAAVRKRVAVVFGGEKGLFDQLTARENLAYWAALYGVPSEMARARVNDLLQEVNLTDRADDRISTYSRGMKQRVHLARGLVSDPDILFLDEPTIGMDPIAARDFQKTILKFSNAGKTILITTHDMAEAEAVCDRVSFINRGELLATEAPARIGSILSTQVRIEFTTSNSDLHQRLAQRSEVHSVEAVSGQSGRFRIEVRDTLHVSALIGHLLAEGVTRLSIAEPTLEEAYRQLIKH